MNLFFIPLDQSYQWSTYPSTQKVIITYNIELLTVCRFAPKEFTETFECGENLWENVREWMENVQHQLKQLANIDNSFAAFYSMVLPTEEEWNARMENQRVLLENRRRLENQNRV